MRPNTFHGAHEVPRFWQKSQLVERIMKELGGLTFFVGYFVNGLHSYIVDNRGSLSIKIPLLCRRLYSRTGNVYDMHPRQLVDEVTINLSPSRMQTEKWKPKKGDIIQLIAVESMTSQLKTSHNVGLCSTSILVDNRPTL